MIYKVAEVQINLWENTQKFLVEDLELSKDDYVVVGTESAVEIGKINDIAEFDDKAYQELSKDTQLSKVLRKADLRDLETLKEYENGKEEALNMCKKLIEKNQLPMKLIDVHFSFDNKRVVFAFIADGRVDFRPLVKDLTKYFQKNIRLQQLGVRDEAKVNGDIGDCGIEQCCRTHLKELGNVNAEQAEAQQISNRGADRLSGICNRLKCCLRYENDLYVELSKKFPEKGSKVKTPGGRGTVVDWQILKEKVTVKLDSDETSFVEIPLDKIN